MCASAQSLMPRITWWSERPRSVSSYVTVTGTVAVTVRVTRPSRSRERSGVDLAVGTGHAIGLITRLYL